MSTRLSSTLSILILFSLFLISCLGDVEHDNPLDPQNNESRVLSGTVSTYYAPRMPIKDALLFLDPSGRVARTGSDGRYSFSSLDTGTYQLICTATGYETDSVSINFDSRLEHPFILNGLPYFKAIELTSHHVSRWFPSGEIYYLELIAAVDDIDGIGDIRSVFFRLGDSAAMDTMQAGFSAGSFQKTVFENQLPSRRLHALAGRSIYFWVKDGFGSEVRSDRQTLSRIIDITPSLNFPVELQTVSADSFTFGWTELVVPFDHTLQINLYNINAGIATQIQTIGAIPGGATQYHFNQLLPSGDYAWTLSLFDTFGNSSTSRQGVFRVP